MECRADIRYRGPPSHRPYRFRLLPSPRPCAHALEANAKAYQGLYRATEAKRLPVPPHDRDHRARHCRDTDPYYRNAPRGGNGCREPLHVQRSTIRKKQYQ